MGSVRLYGATSGYLELQAPDVSPDAALVLPSTGFGKILQVVRATDSTQRSTTSASNIDLPGASVTITPQKSTSTIIVLLSLYGRLTWTSDADRRGFFTISDSSNSGLSGAQVVGFGVDDITGTGTRIFEAPIFLIGQATPATTSAVTYKGRFSSVNSGVTTIARNNVSTLQMYAIEVAA